MTTTVIVVVALPPELLAVTVYVAKDEMTLAVPPIAPVDVSNVRPDGRIGEIDHETTVPPLEVGVVPKLNEPLVNVNELGL